MLVGGAECGPSNPLQGLSKRFDQDRGIQQVNFKKYLYFIRANPHAQDFFGASRRGLSKDVRT